MVNRQAICIATNCIFDNNHTALHLRNLFDKLLVNDGSTFINQLQMQKL